MSDRYDTEANYVGGVLLPLGGRSTFVFQVKSVGGKLKRARHV